MAFFYLKFSPSNTKKHSFDLNTSPTSSHDYESHIEDFGDEGDSIHTVEEKNMKV